MSRRVRENNAKVKSTMRKVYANIFSGLGKAKSVFMAPRAQSGFSLVELLAVIVILTLVTMVVATGIPAAQRAYVSAVDSSNAQILLSTTTTRLRDELSVANPQEIKTEGLADGVLVEFKSFETGQKVRIKNTADKGVTIQQSMDGETFKKLNSEEEVPEVPLVPIKATGGINDNLRTSIDNNGISYNDGIFTVTGIKVKRGGEVLQRAQLETLEIKVIAG